MADTRISVIDTQCMPQLLSLDFTNAPVVKLDTVYILNLRTLRGSGSMLSEFDATPLV